MKILSKQNVFEAALDRLRWLFAEFPKVVVSISGGKDSTVVLELSLRIAHELGRLPLPVFFLDQEAEWTDTVDYVRKVMYRRDVEPLWMQMPMHLDNATSYEAKFLKCWDPECEADWVHPKDPISLKENIYGTDRFKALFPAIFAKHYPGQKLAVITGMRAEESPGRFLALSTPTYKWVSWGQRHPDPDHFNFFPCYDWSYTDVWHAIASEGWEYNRIYDYQYRYGVPVLDMRVSNLHHETALRSLFYLQEADPGLYERLTKRLPGIDTAGKFQEEFYAQRLPFMFASWQEYRDYLIEKLCSNDPVWKANLVATSAQHDETFEDSQEALDRAARAVVQSILCNDYTGTKIKNFRIAFGTTYEKQRIDALASCWTQTPAGEELRKEQDPKAHAWFVRHIKGIGARLEGGRRYYHRGRYKHWLEGDVIRRGLIERVVQEAAHGD